MRLATTGILFTAIVVAVSAAAQTPPTTTARKVVAAAKLPTVTNVPLYFKVQSIAVSPGEKVSVSGTNSVLYQLSESTDVSGVGETKTLNAGDGLLIAAGMIVELKPTSGAPSTLLQFLLSPASDLDRPTATGPAAVKELYQTAGPIPDLKSGPYVLNLTQVAFPAGCLPMHHTIGPAPLCTTSFREPGRTPSAARRKQRDRAPSSTNRMVSCIKWGNPGNEPLTFVTFNINREGVAAVLPGVPARTQ